LQPAACWQGTACDDDDGRQQPGDSAAQRGPRLHSLDCIQVVRCTANAAMLRSSKAPFARRISSLVACAHARLPRATLPSPPIGKGATLSSHVRRSRRDGLPVRVPPTKGAARILKQRKQLRATLNVPLHVRPQRRARRCKPLTCTPPHLAAVVPITFQKPPISTAPPAQDRRPCHASPPQSLIDTAANRRAPKSQRPPAARRRCSLAPSSCISAHKLLHC
jgi:hypothetical protein